MVMGTEKSLTNLSTQFINLSEIASTDVPKSSLLRNNMSDVISGIINVQETAHHYLQELKQTSTKKFQKTD